MTKINTFRLPHTKLNFYFVRPMSSFTRFIAIWANCLCNHFTFFDLRKKNAQSVAYPHGTRHTHSIQSTHSANEKHRWRIGARARMLTQFPEIIFRWRYRCCCWYTTSHLRHWVLSSSVMRHSFGRLVTISMSFAAVVTCIWNSISKKKAGHGHSVIVVSDGMLTIVNVIITRPKIVSELRNETILHLCELIQLWSICIFPLRALSPNAWQSACVS